MNILALFLGVENETLYGICAVLGIILIGILIVRNLRK